MEIKKVICKEKMCCKQVEGIGMNKSTDSNIHGCSEAMQGTSVKTISDLIIETTQMQLSLTVCNQI